MGLVPRVPGPQPMTWRDLSKLTSRYGIFTPPKMAIWYYSLYLINSYPLYWIYTLLVHTLPGVIVDAVLLCLGKRRMAMTVYRKMDKLSDVLRFFSLRQWIVNSRNLRKLLDKMTIRDKKIFFSDLKEMEWTEYFKCYFAGARVFFLQDPLTTLPEARIRYRRSSDEVHHQMHRSDDESLSRLHYNENSPIWKKLKYNK
ncbi:hypothetical protein NQ318_015081 [Aromia moschata]|uniref:Fatty acyl-CoA reductase C-terminal domain-containing protein n=1 Tax=Aromia moschata TaxID=1265417 RepID=A0AAV8YZY5_9CUCU|nr:hypothetical protein NQ318_015081 [Aromia moschata]